jgi:hypothetical protein
MTNKELAMALGSPWPPTAEAISFNARALARDNKGDPILLNYGEADAADKHGHLIDGTREGLVAYTRAVLEDYEDER